MNTSLHTSGLEPERLLSTSIDPLLSKLQTVKGPDSKGNYLAKCPFHHDKNPSLSVHPENGFRCFACGEKGAIRTLLMKLGIEPIFRPANAESRVPAEPDEEETVYDYGSYQVVRRELPNGAKKILQRRIDPGTRKLIYNMDGVSRTLYCLPEVQKASSVIIVEGEKCVEILRGGLQQQGLFDDWAVTTNSGGAGNWQSELSSVLNGKHIVALPDNDEPGHRHCEEVCASIYPYATSIKVIELPDLPPKGDVVDFLERGGKIEDIFALIKIAPAWQIPEVGHHKEDFEDLISVNSVNSRPVVAEKAVYQGLSGEIIYAIEPYSEADPIALITSLLVGFGNMIGRSPHWAINGGEHYTNLFAAIIGKSSRSRKGTSWGVIRELLADVDPQWNKQCIRGGLGSGEGLIHQVRDTISEDATGQDGEENDKRLLAVEEEFSQILQIGRRDGNTLSQTIRNCWDSGNLGTLVRNNPLRATGAHVSILGHCTAYELNQLMSENDLANGFANRFLWMYAERSKLLPLGGKMPDGIQSDLVQKLRRAAEHGRSRGEMLFDAAASELWSQLYEMLSSERIGRLDQITSRAEAQVRRLAMIYALLDCSSLIRVEHLDAANALWQYSYKSALHIFGNSTGSQDADNILEAIRDRNREGMTLTEISKLLHNTKRNRIQKAVQLLLQQDLIVQHDRKTQGRSARVYFAVDSVGNESTEKTELSGIR